MAIGRHAIGPPFEMGGFNMNWKLLSHTLVCGLLTTWSIYHSSLDKWLIISINVTSYVFGVFLAKTIFPQKEF